MAKGPQQRRPVDGLEACVLVFAVGGICVWRTNSSARTGTTVTATRRLAKVMVRANPTKTWPTRPPTKASGRNTATVVRVEAVMAWHHLAGAPRAPPRIGDGLP